jgi:hypothetical protein
MEKLESSLSSRSFGCVSLINGRVWGGFYAYGHGCARPYVRTACSEGDTSGASTYGSSNSGG